MNFEVDLVNGVPQMTWNQAKDIRTNIWISLAIRYGTFFADPTFGCRLPEIKKINPGNIALAKQYIEQALSWLLAVGRATSIIVVVEQDIDDPTRLDIKVDAMQPNGLLIKYQEFRPVGLGIKIDYAYQNNVIKNLGTN